MAAALRSMHDLGTQPTASLNKLRADVCQRSVEQYTFLFHKNAYNLAEPEDVLILAHTFLKFGGKSQPQRSYKNGPYKKECTLMQSCLFFTFCLIF